MVVVNVHLASAGIGRVSPGTAGMVWVGLTAGTGKIETWLMPGMPVTWDELAESSFKRTVEDLHLDSRFTPSVPSNLVPNPFPISSGTMNI